MGRNAIRRYLREEPPERLGFPKCMKVRMDRVVSDRLHQNRTASPVIHQEPPPEVGTLSRSPNDSPSAAEKREVQKKNRVRRAKPDLHGVVGPQIAVHDPFLFRDKSLLDRYPLIATFSCKARLPEDLVQLDYREPRDLAQAHRKRRFA